MALTKQETDRLRKVLRFIISNLNDIQEPLPIQKMKIVDQYMLHCLATYYENIATKYDTMHFNRVCQMTENFVANDLSSFYFSLVKDRLYCDEKNSIERQSAVSTLYWIGFVLTKCLSPLMPVMAQEISLVAPCLKIDLSEPIDETMFSQWKNESFNEKFKIVHNLKRSLTQAKVCKSDGVLLKDKGYWSFFTAKDLAEMFQVAFVQFQDDIEYSYKIIPSQMELCPRCRLYQANISDEICLRCENVVNNLTQM